MDEEVIYTGPKEKFINDSALSLLSQRVCNMLDFRGFSKKKIDRQSEILVIEAILNGSWEHSSAVIGGSFAEGSDLFESDLDKMVHVPNVIVVSSLDEAKHFPKDDVILLMCPENHRPCYQSLTFLTPIIKEDSRRSKKQDLIRFVQEIDGINYLSSEKFIKARIESDTLYGKKYPFLRWLNRHGPCSAFITIDLDIDLVYALSATKWPDQAQNWIERKRKYGWPSKDLIQKVVKTKCSLVPQGNPVSASAHLEWRLSFLLGERLLIWSFNKIQYYCYIITKAILKQFIASEFPDTVDSFILKTTMFWMIEKTPQEFWSKENIFVCIRTILSRLNNYIKHESLPHYFVPTNNILVCKMSFKEHCQSIVIKLEGIIKYLFNCFHTVMGFRCDDICPLCNDSNLSDLAMHGRLLALSPNGAIVREMTCNEILTLETGLDEIKKVAQFLSKKPECISEEHVDKLRKMLHIREGFELYKLYHEDGNNAISIEIVEQSFINAIDKMALDSWLYLGTFYFMQGMVAKAANLVESLLNGQLKSKCTDLKCTTINPLDIIGDETTHKNTHDDSGLRETISVKFCRSDYICLPCPLACECLMLGEPHDHIAIKSAIYAYFLMFIIRLKQKDLDILPSILLKLTKEINRYQLEAYQMDVSFNLLGFCQMESGNFKKAMYYFWKSCRARPETKNPCLYYAILTIKKCQKRKEEKEDK